MISKFHSTSYFNNEKNEGLEGLDILEVPLKPTVVQEFGPICLTTEGELLPITLQIAEAEAG